MRAIAARPCRSVMRAIPASERLFFAVSVLLFAAGAIATVACSTTDAGAIFGMSEMSGSMSMAWMRMPGQSWPAFASTFLGMWIVMMMAMMLPSLVPVLGRYRTTLVLAGAARPDRLAAVAGAGYFVVWNLFGVGAFALGSTLASAAMQWPALARALPFAAGTVVLLASALQFTTWKAHHLACCRSAACACASAGVATAWQYGIRLGLHCGRCCAGLTAVLLVVGVMDLRAMVLVTAAITAERLAPAGERVAHAIGVALGGVGMFLLARASGLA